MFCSFDFGYAYDDAALEKKLKYADILNKLTAEQVEAVKEYGYARYSEGEKDGFRQGSSEN
jgi:hypothetical protein